MSDDVVKNRPKKTLVTVALSSVIQSAALFGLRLILTKGASSRDLSSSLWPNNFLDTQTPQVVSQRNKHKQHNSASLQTP